MKPGKRQKRGTFRRVGAKGPADATTGQAPDISTDNAIKNDSPGRRVWLAARALVHDGIAETPDQPDTAVDPQGKVIDLTRDMRQKPLDSFDKSNESISSQSDESENARPPDAGVVKNVTELKKENQMQTATQTKPLSDSGITQNVDLRDDKPAKLEAVKDATQLLAIDGLGSLFGPVIEDDVKGVRSQIREMIQGELQGELGQRFSRNLRIVIRREIAAAIDDQFDRV